MEWDFHLLANLSDTARIVALVGAARHAAIRTGNGDKHRSHFTLGVPSAAPVRTLTIRTSRVVDRNVTEVAQLPGVSGFVSSPPDNGNDPTAAGFDAARISQ